MKIQLMKPLILLMALAMLLMCLPTLAEEPVEVEFNGIDDWLTANIKVDNTRPWQIDYDIDFESITKYALADHWADTVQVVVRNVEVDHYLKSEVQAYCNASLKYQIACSGQIWKGSEWSDRPFNWSENFETPVTKLHVTVIYDGETYSWLVINREDEAVMDEFTFDAAQMTEELKSCTECELKFYRNPTYLEPDNFVFVYTDTQEEAK